MSDCCEVTALHFGQDLVGRELRSLERDGPGDTTSRLLELLDGTELEDSSVLDVGGGLGAAAEELLKAGAARATLVEASETYVRAAQNRAWGAGSGKNVDFLVGDFVALAPDLDVADVVVLDRVICCDPRMDDLVTAAARKTGVLLAVATPGIGPPFGSSSAPKTSSAVSEVMNSACGSTPFGRFERSCRETGFH